MPDSVPIITGYLRKTMKSILLTCFSGVIMTTGILRFVILIREIQRGAIKNFGQTVYWKESKVAYLKNLFTILLVSVTFIILGFLFFVFYLRQR
jgi:hypothetical protein